jgi:hypothetical protein
MQSGLRREEAAVADEITLEQDVDEALGLLEAADADVMDSAGPEASSDEPEDEEDEGSDGDDAGEDED